MRLIENPPEQKQPEQSSIVNRQSSILKRWLNSLLALSGLAVYFIYVSKGWSLYDKLPGGRGLLLGLAVVVFVALAATRVYVAYGQAQLAQTPALVWRSARVKTWTPVAAIVGVALLVRLWGVSFGLPYLEQVDEWAVADRALHIVQTGNFDPLDYRNPALADNDRQAFTYPSLYMYLQTAVFSLKFLQGVTAEQYDGTRGLDELAAKPDFYLWGRVLTALLGAGTVWLLYAVGTRYYNRWVGLVAALFLAFFYLHVINSRFITTDVPSGFFALLPFLFIYPIMLGKAYRRTYFLAGFCAGLAIGTKYNNGLILLPLVIAHLTGHPWRRWLDWKLFLALLAAGVGFLVSSPFVPFHIPNFLTDVAAVIDHYQNRGHSGYEGSSNWLYYLQAMAAENLLVVGLAVGGILLAFARHRRQELVLLAFPLVSYMQLSTYKVNFTRNLMPIVPFVALFGGLGLVIAVEWLLRKQVRWQTPALAGLAIVAIISPAITITQHANLNAQPTTRARATEWIKANLPRGSKLWLEPFSVELLPRDSFRLEGGKSVLDNALDWYAANGYNYIVLSEAYYKGTLEGGKPQAQATYRALTEGQLPAGFSKVQDFSGDENHPGARILILSTGLKSVSRNAADFSSEITSAVQAVLGGKIGLIGAAYPEKIAAGKTLPLVLFWQSVDKTPRNYTVFVHLLDEKGNRVSQLDLPPLAGTRPTSVWQPGDFIRDDYPLILPANLAPGTYRLVAGLYEAPNGGRLTLPGGSDAVELGTIRVEAK